MQARENELTPGLGSDRCAPRRIFQTVQTYFPTKREHDMRTVEGVRAEGPPGSVRKVEIADFKLPDRMGVDSIIRGWNLKSAISSWGRAPCWEGETQGMRACSSGG